MRLASLIPSITAELVSCLDKCGIRTDTDLLFKPVLEVYQRLPPASISLRELENAVARVAELASAPGISGVDMLSSEMQAHDRAAILSCGVENLDHLLGGFGGCRVIEISGDRQAGKTTLALNIVVRHLAESPDASVLWIDSTGDFSVEQAARLLEYFTSEAASTALERLQISLAFDIESAYNVIGELHLNAPRYSCIVVDPITPILGPLLSAVSAEGHSIMTSFMRQLRIFSQTHSCPILVINNTTFVNPSKTQLGNFGVRKPALGPTFTFLTDATLWLEKPIHHAGLDHDRRYTIRSAEVLRSNTTASESRCLFKISQGKILAFDI